RAGQDRGRADSPVFRMESSLIDVKNMPSRLTRARVTVARLTMTSIAGLASCLLVPGATAQPAQDDAISAPSSALDIPESVVLFGKRDPNIRRATALVNGEVITGTD